MRHSNMFPKLKSVFQFLMYFTTTYWSYCTKKRLAFNPLEMEFLLGPKRFLLGQTSP